MNDGLLYLIANPMKKKQKNIEENIDKELFNILHKKYKLYAFDKIIYDKICKENEKIIIEYTIEKVSEKFINDIIGDILFQNYENIEDDLLNKNNLKHT